MTRLLIAGAGSIGARHARNARSLGVTDIAIVDPDGARRDAVASEVGGHACTSLEQGLALGRTAAIICTPPSVHVETALTCADRGCHLLIEKPLAARADGVHQLQAAIAQKGLRAAVAYQLRFHPAVRRMKELVKTGAIGRLLSIQAEYGQYLPAWRPSRDYRDSYTAQAAQGGGILLDGSHEIDYVRWIGGEVTSVYARAARLSDLEIDVEDTAALVLGFDRPLIGEIHLDCVQRGYSRRAVLIGTEATVRWDARTGLTVISASAAVHEEALVPEGNDPYLAELRAFLDGDLSMHATIGDAARVLEVVAAARQSTLTRREIAM